MKRNPATIAQVGLITAVVALTVGIFHQPVSLFLSTAYRDFKYNWDDVSDALSAPIITSASTPAETKRWKEWNDARQKRLDSSAS